MHSHRVCRWLQPVRVSLYVEYTAGRLCLGEGCCVCLEGPLLLSLLLIAALASFDVVVGLVLDGTGLGRGEAVLLSERSPHSGPPDEGFAHVAGLHELLASLGSIMSTIASCSSSGSASSNIWLHAAHISCQLMTHHLAARQLPGMWTMGTMPRHYHSQPSKMAGQLTGYLAPPDGGECLAAKVRVTPDGWLSIIDIVIIACFTGDDGQPAKNARNASSMYYKRLCSEYDEAKTLSLSFKFPRRWQQDTPVTGCRGISPEASPQKRPACTTRKCPLCVETSDFLGEGSRWLQPVRIHQAMACFRFHRLRAPQMGTWLERGLGWLQPVRMYTSRHALDSIV